MSRFKKAVRTQARLRMGLDGPSGGGKSYTALRFAHAFKADKPNCRIACIEAGERGGLTLYLGESPDDVPFDFEVLDLQGNFSPMEYAAAIEEAGREKFDVLVIDSLSHAWAGAGGALDQVGSASFTDKDGWRKVTPQHNRMIDAILQSPCHVIATLRSKTEYVIETDERGRQVPKKIGLAPIQRAGMEYEFTIYGSIDHNHTLTITKSRCSAMQDLIAPKAGAAQMAPLIRWLATGEAASFPDAPKRATAEEVKAIEELLKKTKWKPETVAKGLAQYQVSSVVDLTTEQAAQFKAIVSEWIDRRDNPPMKVSVTSEPATATNAKS